MNGLRSHLSGQAAEEAVARHYEAQGARVRDRRWRSEAGEIDLVLEIEGVVVFVEVKQGRDWQSAAQRISERQRGRILAAAQIYIAELPDGQNSECRFDAALVDGAGQIEIIENAFP